MEKSNGVGSVCNSVDPMLNRLFLLFHLIMTKYGGGGIDKILVDIDHYCCRRLFVCWMYDTRTGIRGHHVE